METKITERARRVYESWLNDPHVDEVTKEELMSIRNNAMEIEDRFYKDLEFGTGGMRGIMGAGTNRVNVYTIAKATQGLAELLLQNDDHAGNIPSVVIAYDSRHHSSSFAMEAARVLAGNGIKAYLFADMRPTPQLSFAVRHLRASAGIVITASHNPPEYNGYKVYGSSGGQLLPDEADRLIERVEHIEQLSQVRRMSIEQAEELERIEWLKESIDDAYVQAVISNRVRPDVVRDMEDRFRIVYTPLHGSGLIPVPRALRAAGFSYVHMVKEQERPDGSFPTVHSPNPEEREAFRIALQQAKQVDADIIIGTDPDCDRVGTLVKRADGEYEALNGNEIGALLLEYLLSSLKFNGKLPEDGAMIKTIVTGELGARIAKQYGIQVLNTLTGFKYIAEKMDQFEREGTPQFLFGYEESYGFLIGTHCRDKDAVVASVLLCEAACFYKQQGLTLVDVLHELYERHGVHLERQLSITRKGKEGMQQIARTMDAWRQTSYDRIAGVAVVRALDYETGIEGLPRENVLKYELEDGSWICLRPSGTEPKLKAYLAVRKPTVEEAEQAMLRLKAFVEQRLEPEVTSVSHRSDKL